MSGVLAEVAAFLDGSAPLEGVWFGDKHPTKPGPFWWRENLRQALAAQGRDEAKGEDYRIEYVHIPTPPAKEPPHG